MSPDEVRKLSTETAILIPERQNPLKVKRIVFYKDPFFKAISEAQKGPFPYPSEQLVLDEMKAEVAQLRDQVQILQSHKISYAEQPAAANNSAAKATIHADKFQMTDEEAKAALKPSEKEAAAAMAAFTERLNSKR